MVSLRYLPFLRLSTGRSAAQSTKANARESGRFAYYRATQA